MDAPLVFEREARSSDQHDACAVAAWIQRADSDDSLRSFFDLSLVTQ